MKARDFHFVSAYHYFCESEYQTLVTYDLYLEEHGWRCTCPAHIIHHTCKHADFLYRLLNGEPAVLPAREAVKRSNLTLESLFDYSRPPTHSVTRRDRR